MRPRALHQFQSSTRPDMQNCDP